MSRRPWASANTSSQVRYGVLYVVNGGQHALELSRLLWGVPLATSEEARPFIEAEL